MIARFADDGAHRRGNDQDVVDFDFPSVPFGLPLLESLSIRLGQAAEDQYGRSKETQTAAIPSKRFHDVFTVCLDSGVG